MSLLCLLNKLTWKDTKMIQSILGRKVGMTSIFDENGLVIPVTVIEAGPVTVMQVKTAEKDGYCAIQFGYQDKKLQKANKPELGHAKKAETSPKRILRELRVPPEELENFKPGQVVKIEELAFEKGQYVDVAGTSIGKGFSGVMKRHNFKGFKKTHGTHETQRHGGSIGCSASPGKVIKGKKMAGRMGGQRVTVQNLQVVEVRPEDNLILIRGAVPGHKNGTVIISAAKKKENKMAEHAA